MASIQTTPASTQRTEFRDILLPPQTHYTYTPALEDDRDPRRLQKRYHGGHGHEQEGTELHNHRITEPERSVNSRSLRRRPAGDSNAGRPQASSDTQT